MGESPILTPAEARKENREEHEKLDAKIETVRSRIGRLELVVALMAVYAFGQGAAALRAWIGG